MVLQGLQILGLHILASLRTRVRLVCECACLVLKTRQDLFCRFAKLVVASVQHMGLHTWKLLAAFLQNKIRFFAIFQSLCAQIWHMYMHVLRYATTWFAKLATLMCMLIVFKTCVFTNMCICLPYCSCCKFASLGGKFGRLGLQAFGLVCTFASFVFRFANMVCDFAKSKKIVFIIATLVCRV